MIRRFVLLGLAAAVCLLGACTSDKGDDKSGTPSSSAKSSSSTRPTTGLVQPSRVPTKVANSVALRSSVDLTACRKSSGGWLAGGTAKNTRKSKFTYVVTVFFTTDTATVIGFGKTDVKVPAGKTVKWTVTAKFPAVKNTKCVLRGVGKG